MNDENNQKDEGAEDIPYFKCNKCKYLKRADIFFGQALKEYDGEKCPKCGSTDLKEIEDNWLSFFTVTWAVPMTIFVLLFPAIILIYYFWNSFEFLNYLQNEFNAGTLKLMFFMLLGLPIGLPLFVLVNKFYIDPDKEDGKDTWPEKTDSGKEDK